MTDAVRTQELVFFGSPFIAGPECAHLVIVGPKFPIEVGIAGRVETLELLEGVPAQVYYGERTWSEMAMNNVSEDLVLFIIKPSVNAEYDSTDPNDNQLSTEGRCSRPTTEHLSVGRRLYLKRVAAPPPAYSL